MCRKDESLEMLIVRHIMSLIVNLLSNPENAVAWPTPISKIRALSWRVTFAWRAYRRMRSGDDVGGKAGSLEFNDLNKPQCK